MPGTGQTYYVAGAGISGLTLALALAKFGAHVVVLEKSPGVGEFGAGLQISPNARRVLDSLGLDSAVAANSLEPKGIDVIPRDRSKPLVTLELGAIMRERFGAPYVVMHRADLAELLYNATRRFANIDIQFGIKGWDAVSDAKGVTIIIDEQGDRTRTVRGRALIGADGVHSQTRTALLEGPAAHYHGRVAWRTLLPFDAAAPHVALDCVTVLVAPRCHVVCYPLPHRQQVNVALFAPAEHPRAEHGTAPEIGGASLSPRLSGLLQAAGENWTPWPLYAVETSTWHRGNIGLLGDAAHAMVPFQAQGAAMGIEDAAILAPLLIDAPQAETAFARYEVLRRDRVTRVARVSAKNGSIFHMKWPMSAARDLVIRTHGSRGHLRRLDWLYGYDALSVGISTRT
jgi:salicylate hydroxylase